VAEGEKKFESGMRFTVVSLPLGNWRIWHLGAFEGRRTAKSTSHVLQDLTAVPDVISFNWQDLAVSGLSHKMYQCLLALASYEEGWNGPGSRGMNASSLSTFLRFWKQVREHSVEPELVLTPQGNLQAEWSKDGGHYLEIDFRGENEKALFGLFDGRKAVIEGAAPLDDVIRVVMFHRKGAALRWRCDGD